MSNPDAAKDAAAAINRVTTTIKTEGPKSVLASIAYATARNVYANALDDGATHAEIKAAAGGAK